MKVFSDFKLQLQHTIIIMITEPDIKWTRLPLAGHQGLIVSKGVLQYLDLEEVRSIFLCANLETGFEMLQDHTEIKYIRNIENDTLWILRWKYNGENQIATILGSEF